MTEYWVSNAKKFCEICKVWIQDNKISLERHETGGKHKAMLQQKLRSIGQQQREREAEHLSLQATIAQMEQAASVSMKKGAEKAHAASHGPNVPSANKTYFSIKKGSSLEDVARQIEMRKKQRKLLLEKSQKSEFWKDDDEDEISWVQAYNDDGGSYYWNIYTAETRWETPDRFYTAEEYGEKYNVLSQEAEQATSKAAEEVLKKMQEPGPSEAKIEDVASSRPSKRAKIDMEKAVKAAQKAAQVRSTILPGRLGLEEIPLPEPNPTVSRATPQVSAEILNRVPVSLIPQPKTEIPDTDLNDDNCNAETSSIPSESNAENAAVPKMFVPPLNTKPNGPYGPWMRVESKPEQRASPEREQKEVVEALHAAKEAEDDFQFGEKTATVSKKKAGVVEFRKRKTSNRNVRTLSKD